MPNFNVPSSDGAVQAADVIARAATANPTNAPDGQMVAIMADKAGRVTVTEGHTRENCSSQSTTITASTAETTIVTAGGAGVFNDLTGLIITCTGDTAIATLTLRDATGGTAKAIFDYPNAAAAPNTPLIVDFTPPLSQAAANGNWTLQASVNAGTIHVLAQFIKNS